MLICNVLNASQHLWVTSLLQHLTFGHPVLPNTHPLCYFKNTHTHKNQPTQKQQIYDEKIKRSQILSSACRTTLNEDDEHGGRTHDVSLKIAHTQQFSFKSNFLLFVSFDNNSAFFLFQSVPWSTNQATTATVTMTLTAITASLFDKKVGFHTNIMCKRNRPSGYKQQQMPYFSYVNGAKQQQPYKNRTAFPCKMTLCSWTVGVNN